MNDLVIRNMDDVNAAAKLFIASGLVKDSKGLAVASVLIMAGNEYGIGPMEAIRGLKIIDGKVVMTAGMMSTLVKRSTKYNYRISEDSGNEQFTLEWFENGESVGHSSFTIEEARNAGLMRNSVWNKYTSDMLFARALTRGARRFAPDVLGGNTYLEDEIQPEKVVNITPRNNDSSTTSPKSDEKVLESQESVDQTVASDDQQALNDELERARERSIHKILVDIGKLNPDDLQSIKNEYMDRSGNDFPSKFSALDLDNLRILEGMLLAKVEAISNTKEAEIDRKGYKAISDAFDILDSKGRGEIMIMFEAEYDSWCEIDDMTQEQLSKMEGWLVKGVEV